MDSPSPPHFDRSARPLNPSGKFVAEHGQTTLGRFLGGFVLDHIPMLDQNAIVDANDVRRNPVNRLTEARESPVHDHVVSLSHDRSRLVPQRGWQALDEIEQTLTTRCYMSAVLDVMR